MDINDISILNLMPPNLAEDKNVQMAAKAFDEVLQEIIKQIPSVSIIPNIANITDNILLDLLAWQFHVDFYDTTMPIETKRQLVLNSLDWHTRKGTPSAVEEIVSTVFADATIEEWFDYGGEPYFFRISAPIENEKEIDWLIKAVFSVKNTRSWIDYIRAIKIVMFDMFIGIGLVNIGITEIPLEEPSDIKVIVLEIV